MCICFVFLHCSFFYLSFFKGYDTLREDRTVINLGSDPSVYTHSSPEHTTSPLRRTSTLKHSSEDLYSWMAKQDTENTTDLKGLFFWYLDEILIFNLIKTLGYMESKIDTTNQQSTLEDSTEKEIQQPAGLSLYPIHDSVRLMDSNLIFQPLLSSLGVMPQQLKLASLSDAGEIQLISLSSF